MAALIPSWMPREIVCIFECVVVSLHRQARGFTDAVISCDLNIRIAQVYWPREHLRKANLHVLCLSAILQKAAEGTAIKTELGLVRYRQSNYAPPGDPDRL